MDEFLIREATLSDKQAVLDCHTNVYDGFDYLPEFYDYLLRLNNAKSFVLLHGDKVIGFNTATIVDDGNTVVSRAARINPDYEGKGLYRMLDQHVTSWAKSKHVCVKAQTSTPKNSVVLKPSFSEKNRLLISKSYYIYLLELEKTRAKPVECDLTLVDDDLLSEYIAATETSAYLFPDDRIIVEFIPFKPVLSNVPLLRGPEGFTEVFSDVRTEESQWKGLLSFGTMFKIRAFSYKYAIDIYGSDIKSFERHVQRHMLRMHENAEGTIAIALYLDDCFPSEMVDTVLQRYDGVKTINPDPACRSGYNKQQLLFEKYL